ncbi:MULTISPECIES: hypothetical protein [Nitrosomonas]|uniref:hypothetical protein n=1 Tax=Nitrosomonas TaxID=914 RepID=UPI00118732C5|nr:MULTISPECIES: hypothetical protein [Nitrosomonas]UVS62179.1 hypothetical protein NX761_03330 [Nitrosomonas sp. PLL12]
MGSSRVQRNTDWMYSGKIGLSTHYFAQSPDELEQRAIQLKIDEIANQAANVGAAWFLFTLYHQPWLMMAPNETYDRILGINGFTSTRDVPLELSNALRKKNIRLMLYINLRLDPKSHVSPKVREAMGGWPPNDKLVQNIAAVLKEFSLRYETKVSGWWIDGVQYSSEWSKSPHREQWFKEIADALRAGNPDALVAFNPGLKTIRYSLQNDYIAGESVDLKPIPDARCIDGAQWHLWTYLGGCWGSGGTRYSKEELGDYVSLVTSRGGALTFEVGTIGIDVDECVRKESQVTTKKVRRIKTPYIGYIDPEQIEQIKALRKYELPIASESFSICSMN